jgi:signal transduction histidine kinase
MEWIDSPIFDAEGRVVEVQSVGRDSTERRFLEEQLAQAQRLEAIGRLAAGIAHEINTPTQYVGDNTRFLQESFTAMLPLCEKYERLRAAARTGSVPPELLAEVDAAANQADVPYIKEEIPKAIQQSLDGLARVTKIVRAMKEFSHPGGQQRTPTDINHAIEMTIDVCRNEWKYVAETVTDFDQNLPSVPCFPADLNQVILNLIVNAAHAIADVVGDGAKGKGKITITTRRLKDWAEIRVADTGTGIAPQNRSKIFQPFFTTKEVGRGTGQGLAMARNIVVKKHAGTIDFETEVGRGTTFVIRLPLGPSPSS